MDSTLAKTTDTSLQAEDGMNQYLTFMLAGEEYGVDILRVQEIKGWSGVTPMPNMPDYILGVINLRGTIVPVIDLRKQFDMGSIEFDQTTVVIVVRVNGSDRGARTMGIVVDAVSEVYSVARTDLKPAPDFGGAINSESIMGLATLDDKMLILLDIDHLMHNSVSQKFEEIEQDT